MIRVPNPWLILGALSALVSAYAYGHHKGWMQRDTDMQIEIAKKNEEARAKEQAMVKAVAAKDEELRKANNHVAQKQTDLNRLIAAGRVRLPSASCPQASADPATASGNRDDATSESDRETLRLIAEIAADGDRAINQLNACIAAYDEMRNVINAQR